MKPDTNQIAYIEKLIEYTEKCLAATCKESEASVEIVGKLLDTLTQDIARISAMSSDTVQALSDVRGMIKESNAGRKVIGAVSVRSLVLALKQINKEHKDIQDVIGPLIMTLQFQDRVRQQMENMSKMLRIWLAYRQENNPQTEEDLSVFGTLLGAPTTTEEERDILKKIFPGITFAATVQSNDDFFL
jgi:hypothetical protein